MFNLDYLLNNGDIMRIGEFAAPGVHETVLNLIKDKSKGKVLDIASGLGNMSLQLNKFGFEVYAADINPDYFLPESINCLKVDANEELPWEDETFEMVISVETIEHLENPWNFIREVHRILKTNGTFILTTPNVESWLSKIMFLIYGHFNLFGKFYADTDHITPIFNWNLQLMIEDKFIIEDVVYTGKEMVPILPRIGIKLRPGFENQLFGSIRIIELRKI